MSKIQIIKNLIIVCLATAVQFSVFGSSVSLVSSIRIKDGLGNYSQLILYLAFLIGNFTIANACLRIFGMKNCIGIGIVTYSVSMVGNFKPTLPVFATTSVINGLGAALYWVSISCYIMQLAEEYGKPDNIERTKFAFMGIFMAFFGSSTIWGNIVSFVLFHVNTNSIGGKEENRNISELCGVNFCDWYVTGSHDIMQTPPDEQIWTLSIIFVASAVAAGLCVLIFADPLQLPNQFQNAPARDLLLCIVKCFKDPYHLLLGLISFLSGLVVCFHGTDFPKAFISCTLGVRNIGYITMAGGVTQTVCSVIAGFAVRKIDRVYFITAGTIILLGCIVAMSTWTPTASNEYFLFIVTIFWHFSDTIFQGQLRAVYGVFFTENKEAAFGCFLVFQNIGILLAYAYDSYLCIFPKLLIIAIFSVISIGCYLLAEYLFRKKIKSIAGHAIKLTKM